MAVKSFLSALICLLLPPVAPKSWLLRRLGWRIDPSARVGCSWIRVRQAVLGRHARIGHGNFVQVDWIWLDQRSYIGHLNRIQGPLGVALRVQAGIGNDNRVIRSPRGVTWGRSILHLGIWSKITAAHAIDCSRSVRFGDYSTLAGRGSQVWTHGYLHAPQGLERFRTDGRVQIGNNVYIGSASVINAGVRIGDAITVGTMTCVARSILEPGLYVNQPLRLVRLDYQQARLRHPEVRIAGLVETVVNKHPESSA